MKFARLLRDAIPEQPDVESLFQCYKKLKKLIKRLDSAINEQESIASGGGPEGSDSDDDGRDATSGPTSATAAREEEGDGPASVGGGRAGDPARGCTVEPAEVSEGERSAAVEELPAGTSALPPSRASATGGPPRVAPMPEPLESVTGPQGSGQFVGNADAAQREEDFVQALASNVSAFNQIFLEKEENAMMWLHQLEEACDANPGREESSSLYQSLAEFHAETLMVMHWSITAYTCAVKILKKHQKHTGLLIKHDDLLSQPFCSTEQLTSMLRKAEEKMAQLKACKQIGDDSQSQETPARPHVNLGMGLELGLGIGSKLEPARPESWQAGKSSRLQTDALHRDSSGVSLELSLGSGHEFLSTLRPYPLPPWRGNSMPATLPDLNAVGVGEKRSRAEDSEEVIQP